MSKNFPAGNDIVCEKKKKTRILQSVKRSLIVNVPSLFLIYSHLNLWKRFLSLLCLFSEVWPEGFNRNK